MTRDEAEVYHHLLDLLRDAVRDRACWVPRALRALAEPPIVERPEPAPEVAP